MDIEVLSIDQEFEKSKGPWKYKHGKSVKENLRSAGKAGLIKPGMKMGPSKWKEHLLSLGRFGTREMGKSVLSSVLSIDQAYEDLKKADYELSEKTRTSIGTVGSKKREKMAGSNFLIPGEKKYPVKLGGSYSKKLLMAAYRRATMQGRADIAGKASRIMKREFGKEIGKEKKEKKD